MADGAQSNAGTWQRLKTKFLSLTLRAQIFSAIAVIALVVVIVVGATTIITVSNPDAVAGVTLRFEPTALTRIPGQQLNVELFVDTAGRDVNAVNASFDFDTSRLDITCNSAVDCPGIVIDSAWETIAQLSRSGSRLNISLGTTVPVNGTGVLIGAFSFTVPSTATAGDATATFDETVAAVIADDGFGTNIIDSVQNEEWTIDTVLYTNGLEIISGPLENVDCGTSEVVLSWTTNEISDSNVAYSTTPCPGCTWDQFIANGASVISQDGVPNGTQNHQVPLNLGNNTLYYYRVMSVSQLTGAWNYSGENDVFTGCVAPPADTLTITNLAADPSARSAAITWNTSVLADSEITGLSPANTRGVSSWRDVTQTLSHSITATNLAPATRYCVNVQSTTLQVVSGPTSAQGNICFDTLTEDLALDSNIVLKVNRDRSCGQWLSCASSVTVEDVQGEVRDLCFDYALCEELDPENNGECLSVVTTTPGTGASIEPTIVYNNAAASTVAQVKNLTGYSKIGAKWRGTCNGNPEVTCSSDLDCGGAVGSCVTGGNFLGLGDVSGYFPVPAMSQVGSSYGIVNNDFEAGFAFPWQTRFESDEEASVQAITDRTVLERDFNKVLSIRPAENGNFLSGAVAPLGNSLRAGPNDEPMQYYISFDARSSDENIDKLIVQFGFNCSVPPNSTQYDYSTYFQQSTDVVPVSAGWQRIIAGPLEFSDDNQPQYNQTTCLAFLVPTGNCSNDGSSCSNSSQCTSGTCQILDDQFKSVYVDNIEIQPVLNVRPGNVSTETHITRSCRQYPSEDAPVCRYFDLDSGRELQGWEGYCMQTDPRNPRRCIQWVPIDLVAGSSSAMAAYGQAGYGTEPTDRLPLYYCTQSRGNGPYEVLSTARSSFDSNLRFLHQSCDFLGNTYTCGWPEISGMLKFDLIAAKETGRSLTTESGLSDDKRLYANSDPLYIYDIEQIVFDISNAEASDWPRGRFSLNHGNNFEVAWCGGTDAACPESQSSLFDPTNETYYWKDVVTDIDACRDLPAFRNQNGAETNMWGIEAVFDDEGAFLGLQGGLCDDSAKHGWMVADVIVYLREWCTEVSQVVDPFGNNTAWVERVHNNRYEIPGLGYTLNQDLAPYGGIIAPQPDYDPSQWDYSAEERNRQPLLIEPPDKTNFPLPPHQARASSPYGGIRADEGICVDNVYAGICWSLEWQDTGFIPLPVITPHAGVTCETNEYCQQVIGEGALQWCATAPGATGSVCVSDKDCDNGQSCRFTCNTGIGQQQVSRAVCISGQNVGSDCASNQDCGIDDSGSPGRCTGVVPPSLVNEDEYFAQLQCEPSFSPASRIFARSERVWEWDFAQRKYIVNNNLGWDITGNREIANPPQVKNIEFKAGSGGVVDTTLNTINFGNQNFGKITVSFNSIVDEEQVPLVRYTVDWGDGKLSEESSLEIAPQSTRPHVLTHTYLCPGGGCSFQPRIQIEDNWGWCSGTGGNYAGGGKRCESWDVVPGRVIFGGGGITASPPTANAMVYRPGSPPPHGTSITVLFDDFVVLDGSDSFDRDGSIVAYRWHSGSQGGPVISTQPVFTSNFTGNTTVWLEVEDNTGATAFASVSIAVSGSPPPPPSSFGYCTATSGGSCASTAECNEGYTCLFYGYQNGDPAGKCSLGTGGYECTNTAACSVGLFNQKCFEFVCSVTGDPCNPVPLGGNLQSNCPATSPPDPDNECIQGQIIL